MSEITAETVLDNPWLAFVAEDGLRSMRVKSGAEQIEALERAGFVIVEKSPEPIVWDGSRVAERALDEALGSINDLTLRWSAEGTPNQRRSFRIYRVGDRDWTCIAHGWRIQIVGNSFVILPPEEVTE